MDDYSAEVFKRAIEDEKTIAVEILDIDFFKGFNDHYGHQKGDECIKMVASAVKSMEEFGAFVSRYGGDEFVLIYENVTKEQIVEYTAELRKRVLALQMEHSLSKISNVVTISQGVCIDTPTMGIAMGDYLQIADNMLYRVKQRKRNNFCIGNLLESSDQIVMSYL